MKRLIIINGQLILPEGIRNDLVMVCENGKITDLVSAGGFLAQAGDEVIDAAGKYVSAGFIDIHLHGGGGHDFMDGTVEAYLGAAETHARYGTSALLPTTLTSTTDELMKTFAIYKEAVARNTKGAKFLGLHLEGPYFAYSQRGAQDPKYLRNPEPEEYEAILAASDDIVRWSLAPELPGALAFGDRLAERGILASVAHSDAIYEEVLEATRHGFSHVTHLYSAMSTVTRRNAFRYAGVLEAAYLLDNMTVEIIADGVHIPKPLLEFVYRFKGPVRTALCTDAMRGAGMPDGKSILGSLDKGQEVIIEDGVAKLPDRTAFAGSTATTDRLVRTMVQVAGVSLTDTIRMMTLTPATIMKIDDRKGTLEKGKDADLVIFDGNIQVSYTISEGNVLYRSER